MRDYRNSLRDYVDGNMRDRPHVAEIFTLSLPAFYAKHEAALRKNPTDRELNGSIALMLLREFEAQREHWESVRWLNARRTDAALFGKRVEAAGKPAA